jgi:hypothetical protein
MARVGIDADIVTQSHCLRVAELIAIAEELRAEASGEELRPDMINAITRIESTASRAERALFKDAPDAEVAALQREHDEIMAKYRYTPKPVMKMTGQRILEAASDPHLFGPWFKDKWFKQKGTWENWFAYLAAVFGLPMTESQLITFKDHGLDRTARWWCAKSHI